MDLLKTASVWMLVVFCGASASAVQKEKIIAEPGQTLLPCRSPSNRPVTAVEWSKEGLGDQHVLLFLDGRYDSANQHPSFVNRVELQDRWMEGGDLSLVLKNATANDSGTYECRVPVRGTDHWKRSTQEDDPLSSVDLMIPGGGQREKFETNWMVLQSDCGIIQGILGLVVPLSSVLVFGLWE
ncbi:uncharacterized protein KZ484_018735 [Pholidichthys leucotaenia]